MPSSLSFQDKNEYAIRSLEVAEIQCGEDGEFYARQLKYLFAAVEHDVAPERQPVLESVVEKVLLYIKDGECFVCMKSLERLTVKL
jgi:AP-4 complex subunit epsilon-1